MIITPIFSEGQFVSALQHDLMQCAQPFNALRSTIRVPAQWKYRYFESMLLRGSEFITLCDLLRQLIVGGARSGSLLGSRSNSIESLRVAFPDDGDTRFGGADVTEGTS